MRQHHNLNMLNSCTRETMILGARRNQYVWGIVFVKDHKQKTALYPLFIGPFQVVAIKGHTVQICDPQRGIRTMHLNNCRLHKQSQMVILLTTGGADLE